MRGVLALLAVAAVTIGIAWWAAGLTGTVAATIAGYTIQTTTPVALVALVVLVLAIHLALRLLSGLFGVPARLGRRTARRRRAAGDKAVTRTLVALAANDAGTARTQSGRARRLLGDTPQTLLHAAEAARLAGREDEASALFRLLSEREDAGFLGLRGLFRQAMAREDWQGATALLRRAEGLRPGNAWLRTERSELAVRTGNWQQAIALAPPDAPRAAFAVAAAQSEPDVERAIGMAAKAWKDSPGFAPAAMIYATKLRESGRESRARGVLRDAWRQSPHPDIATLALANVTDPPARMRDGGKLAQANPGHPESLFLTATLALAAGQPEEARRHAEAARNAGLNQQRLWKLFSDIDAQDHGGTDALPAQPDAIRRATAVEPDSGWRCEVCGTAQAQWMAVCPSCHTPGRIGWGAASRPKLITG